jgi:hypothetical protein
VAGFPDGRPWAADVVDFPKGSSLAELLNEVQLIVLNLDRLKSGDSRVVESRQVTVLRVGRRLIVRDLRLFCVRPFESDGTFPSLVEGLIDDARRTFLEPSVDGVAVAKPQGLAACPAAELYRADRFLAMPAPMVVRRHGSAID